MPRPRTRPKFKPRPAWQLETRICKRPECRKPYHPQKKNQTYCTSHCRYADWARGKATVRLGEGEVIVGIKTDPETGKRFIMVPLD